MAMKRTAVTRLFYCVVILSLISLYECVESLLPLSCFGYHEKCRANRDKTNFLSLTRARPLPFQFQLHATSQKQDPSDDIASLEREVMASVQAQLDTKRVVDAFLQNKPSSSLVPSNSNDPLPEPQQSSWQVPAAAAVVASTFSFVIFHSPYVTALVLVSVYIAASGDPLEEDSLAGAVARILGRFTLQSVQASQPKIRALARVVVTGEEEILQLQQRLQQLEEENEQLLLWKTRRIRVDQVLPTYSLDQLKDLARDNGISVGGTKSQLLLRLVEAGIAD
jgi:hypothetical protein